YVASHDVPLVVLDIWMKEMTGLEVLARLCAVSPQTHVIVITGREDSAARITAMQIGIVAFLTKPFDGEQFLETVHRALGHPPDAFWSTLAWPSRALTAQTLLDDSAESSVGALRRRTFLRIAPSGTDVHFAAHGIQRVYRCYSSRTRTGNYKVKTYGICFKAS